MSNWDKLNKANSEAIDRDSKWPVNRDEEYEDLVSKSASELEELYEKQHGSGGKTDRLRTAWKEVLEAEERRQYDWDYDYGDDDDD